MLIGSIYAFIVGAFAVFTVTEPGIAAESPCPSLLDQKFANLMDEPVSLCQFSGKVLLIVNTASECGYTPQYEGLEKLYRRYSDKGFMVLGFPANDFGGQEPGSNKQIAQFCRLNYGVTFPMFAKTSVVGANANPLYRTLATLTGKPRSATRRSTRAWKNYIVVIATRGSWSWDFRRTISAARSRDRTSRSRSSVG